MHWNQITGKPMAEKSNGDSPCFIQGLNNNKDQGTTSLLESVSWSQQEGGNDG